MNHASRIVSLGFACSLAAVLARPARAESLYGDRESFWQGQLGVRSMFVTDRGFDAFATNNALTQVSLGATRTVWDADRLSFAPGLVWDYGERSASARGQGTSLASHRLALALEGRYHLFPWAYGLMRLTPGAVRSSAEVEDPLAPAPYVAQQWVFAFDASVGANFLLFPHREETSFVRWWLAAEGGYSYAGSTSLLLHADLPEGDPRRTADLDLGKLAMSGGFFRIYGSVTY